MHRGIEQVEALAVLFDGGASPPDARSWRPRTAPPSIPGVCFSIEPGVYLKEFGVRSEIDMYVGEGQAEVTGGIQRELLLLA